MVDTRENVLTETLETYMVYFCIERTHTSVYYFLKDVVLFTLMDGFLYFHRPMLDTYTNLVQ